MKVANVSRAALAACLLCVLGQGVAAEKATDKAAGKPSARPAHAATAEAVAADPAGVWRRFRATAELGSAYEAYDVVDAVGYDHAAVDADKCREQAAALRTAVESVPVSIALHRVALMCAEATGDQATAERESLALAALSKHALAGAGDTPWRRPILVLSPRDVYATLALLGYEFRYEYYRDVHPKRYFPLVVASWDPESKIERHLSFDYVDAAATIDRGDTYSDYPFQRTILVNSFVEGQAKSADPLGRDMNAVFEGIASTDPAEQLAHYRAGAAEGGLSSLSAWIRFCDETPIKGCTDGLVDALLPLAEQKHAMPLAMLALLHARGLGVKRDEAAADALLAASDARWHGDGGTMMFVALEMMLGDRRMSDASLARIRKSVADGNTHLELLKVVAEYLRAPGSVLDDRAIEVLSRASNNGTGIGYGILAEYYDGRKMAVKAEEARRLSAEHGHPVAQRQRALQVAERRGEAARDVWHPLLVEAAHGGDAIAMRMLAHEASRRGEPKQAGSWLLAAVDAGDEGALYDLAGVYETETKGLPGDVDDAVRYYETLASDEDGEYAARSRQRLAVMALDGRGMKRNPARAKAWLLEDAERGDIAAQMSLFGLHAQTGAGVVDEAEAVRWAERAIAGEPADEASQAKSVYGAWLVARPDASRRTRGLQMLRDAAGDGETVTGNNLAWALCVSAYDDLRDAASGLAVARQLERRELAPGMLDTVAACYAANGRFDDARRLQQRAIDALPRGADGKPRGSAGIFSRLALYKDGKAYVEKVADTVE